MTHSKLTKVSGFLLLMFVLILSSGCDLEEGIDSLASKLAHNQKIDYQNGRLDACGECRKICEEKYNVTIDELIDSNNLYGEEYACYNDCYKLL